MSFFTQGNNRYEDWKFENECNILDVLQDFPSVQVSADLLLTQLPLLQPVRMLITQHITSAQQHQEFCHWKMFWGLVFRWDDNINSSDVRKLKRTSLHPYVNFVFTLGSHRKFPNLRPGRLFNFRGPSGGVQ